MKTILNVIWLVLCGFWMFLAYIAAGILLCITIIGIPFGLAAFRIGLYALWPFGYTVVDRRDSRRALLRGQRPLADPHAAGGSPSVTSPPASCSASRSSASHSASPTSS